MVMVFGGIKTYKPENSQLTQLQEDIIEKLNLANEAILKVERNIGKNIETDIGFKQIWDDVDKFPIYMEPFSKEKADEITENGKEILSKLNNEFNSIIIDNIDTNVSGAIKHFINSKNERK
jgi:hypothetical protein